MASDSITLDEKKRGRLKEFILQRFGTRAECCRAMVASRLSRAKSSADAFQDQMATERRELNRVLNGANATARPRISRDMLQRLAKAASEDVEELIAYVEENQVHGLTALDNLQETAVAAPIEAPEDYKHPPSRQAKGKGVTSHTKAPILKKAFVGSDDIPAIPAPVEETVPRPSTLLSQGLQEIAGLVNVRCSAGGAPSAHNDVSQFESCGHQEPLACEARFVHMLPRAHDWQDCSAFMQLCDWWRGNWSRLPARRNGAATPFCHQRSAVCALVGIAGAGKTSIAERFLRVLPGGLVTPETTPKDETLPQPRRLFVFSFQDAPNPDTFFTEVYAWLSGTAIDQCTKSPSYERTLQLLSRVAQASSHASSGSVGPRRQAASPGLLLVLDGFELVQDDGTQHGHCGHILDGRLRDLILRASDGWLPGVTLIITSHYQLFDLLTQRSTFYQQIDVEELDPSAALTLLRSRGVAGTDSQLLLLAKESGFHALTVDLLAGYASAFAEGDPRRIPSLATAEISDDVAAGDPRSAAVQHQMRQFNRLAECYREALAARDPATLALMERVCLFYHGVNAETLAAIFTGAGKEGVSGLVLAHLTPNQLAQKLRVLVRMRLLNHCSSPSPTPSEQPVVYRVHPAVRHGFLRGMDKDAERHGHEAVRNALINALPEALRNASEQCEKTLIDICVADLPSDIKTLDLLEEIIFHTLDLGLVWEGWLLYWNVIGNYRNLGLRLAAFERGERICRMFAVLQRHPIIDNEHALYLTELGQLTHAAKRMLETQEPPGEPNQKANEAARWNNLGNIWFLSGYLRKALAMGRRVQKLGFDDHGNHLVARVAVLRGDTVEALKQFDRIFEEARMLEDSPTDTPLLGAPTNSYAQLLLLLGRHAEAIRIAKSNRQMNEFIRGPESLEFPECYLIMAAGWLGRENVSRARKCLAPAVDWAVARDAKQVLCWCALLAARIHIHEATRQKAKSKRFRTLATAMLRVAEGLHIASDSGYGIYHIELLLEKARIHLLRGEPRAALDDLSVALDHGQQSPPGNDAPTLLPAMDPECGFAWGVAEGRQLRAEALILEVSQMLGRTQLSKKELATQSAKIRSQIAAARSELEECLKLRSRLQDRKVRIVKRSLKNLQVGRLTVPLFMTSETTKKVKRPTIRI